MCARLGIRTAYSHAHRPQENGRVEVAGARIYNILRKLHCEKSVNWVQALPRVLWIQNNLSMEVGLSPYQLLFGRDRLEGSIPYTPPVECENATEFFERINNLDTRIMHEYQRLHDERQRIYNLTRKPKAEFKEGDKVWVLRTRTTAHKLESWWLGPAKVFRRVGMTSYQVVHKPGEIWDVARDFLKPYVEDNLLGTGVPLYYHQGTVGSTGLGDTIDNAEYISGHRYRNNKIEFLVKWRDVDEEVWEPSTSFVYGFSEVWMKYLTQHGLESRVQALF